VDPVGGDRGHGHARARRVRAREQRPRVRDLGRQRCPLLETRRGRRARVEFRPGRPGAGGAAR
jgi:hypothetical protein